MRAGHGILRMRFRSIICRLGILVMVLALAEATQGAVGAPAEMPDRLPPS